MTRYVPVLLVALWGVGVACTPDAEPPAPPIEEPTKPIEEPGPPVVPSAPGAVRAEAEVGGATLTWSIPADPGGSALTGYRVESEPREASSHVTVEGTTARVTGLRAGATYRFSVSARNEVGEGPMSTSASVTLPDVPGVPEGVAAARGDRQVEVAWTPPASDGGRPVLGYLVTARPQGTQVRVEATARLARVTGLPNGVASTWTVRALNVVGEGPDSRASASVVPATVPSGVREVNVVAGVRELTVTWSEPADTGGVPVMEYVVTLGPQGLIQRQGPSSRSTTFTGLESGTEYTLSVAARNEVGAGPVASPLRQRTPDVPRPPEAVRAESEVGGATLTWSAAADTGGSALTGYQVLIEPREASQRVVVEGTTARVTGLRAGATYHFGVSARNAVGLGPISAAVAVTVPDVPGVPQGVSATRGDRRAEVAWMPPATDGGRPVLGYLITARPQGLQVHAEATASSVVVRGLTNGEASTFTVRARNAVGEGLDSLPSARVVPASVPSAPGGVSASSGVRQLTATWSEPADTGGLPVAEYVVTAEPGGYVARVGGSVRSATVTGLRDHTEYTLGVVARNEVGTGPSASALQRTLNGPPAAPQAVKATRGVRAAKVSWEAPADDGGAPVTGYSVEVQPTGRRVNVGAQTREVTVTELPSTQAYTLAVSALNEMGTGPATPSSLVRPLPTAARVSALEVPVSTSGCVSIAYGLGQDDGDRVDVLVEVEAQGSGTFRPATQAGSTDHEGTLALSSSPGGTAHRFLWNRALDVRGAASVQVRVSARIAGAATTSRTVAVSLPAASQGCESFLDSAHASTIQETPYTATMGDFDQDGKLDLIIGTQSRANPTLLKGLGNGFFLPGQTVELGLQLASVSRPYVTADLDGDGALELLWVEQQNQVMAVARGLGNGSFAPAQRYTPGVGLGLDSDKPGLAVADFNGDGRLDVAMNSSRGLGFFPNQGPGMLGVFQPVNALAADFFLAADLDADGRQDLVVPHYNSPGLVLLSNGDGTFRQQPTDLPLAPLLKDFTRDGWVDALYVSGKEIFLRRGDGQGGFAAATLVGTASAPLEASDTTGGNLTAADFDGDGLLDVALATNHDRNSHLLALFKGRADGTFASEVGLPVPRTSGFLTHGDFNGDTVADLVVLQSASPWSESYAWTFRDVRVWPGGSERMARSTPIGPRGYVATGDLNGDGWADVISEAYEATPAGPSADQVKLRLGGPGGLSAPQLLLDLSRELVIVSGIDIVHVDADPALDVVIHCDDRTILLLNDGSGTLRRVPGPQLDGTSYVESGDVNKDGKPDLVFTARNSPQSFKEVRLRLGVGDGTFGPATVLGNVYSEGPSALVDLNRDGSLDIVMHPYGVGGIAAQVLLGRGDGSFIPGPALALGGPGRGEKLRVADMDQDGIPDVVYCSYVAQDVSALHVLKGAGDGSFTLASSTQTSTFCSLLRVVDLDGDGWRDVLLGRWTSDSIALWNGRPQGQLAPERIFGTHLHDPPAGGLRSLAVLDANGDGRLDVLSGYGGRVSTLLLQR